MLEIRFPSGRRRHSSTTATRRRVGSSSTHKVRLSLVSPSKDRVRRRSPCRERRPQRSSCLEEKKAKALMACVKGRMRRRASHEGEEEEEGGEGEESGSCRGRSGGKQTRRSWMRDGRSEGSRRPRRYPSGRGLGPKVACTGEGV